MPNTGSAIRPRQTRSNKYFDWWPYYEELANLPVGVEYTARELASKFGIARNQPLARLTTIIGVGEKAGYFSITKNAGPSGSHIFTRVGAFTAQDLYKATNKDGAKTNAKYRRTPKTNKPVRQVRQEGAPSGSLIAINDAMKDAREALDRLDREVKTFQERVLG